MTSTHLKTGFISALMISSSVATAAPTSYSVEFSHGSRNLGTPLFQRADIDSFGLAQNILGESVINPGSRSSRCSNGLAPATPSNPTGEVCSPSSSGQIKLDATFTYDPEDNENYNVVEQDNSHLPPEQQALYDVSEFREYPGVLQDINITFNDQVISVTNNEIVYYDNLPVLHPSAPPYVDLLGLGFEVDGYYSGSYSLEFIAVSFTLAPGNLEAPDSALPDDLSVYPFFQIALKFRSELGDTLYIRLQNPNISEVPIPAAAYLFGSSLLGLVAIRKRKSGENQIA